MSIRMVLRPISATVRARMTVEVEPSSPDSDTEMATLTSVSTRWRATALTENSSSMKSSAAADWFLSSGRSSSSQRQQARCLGACRTCVPRSRSAGSSSVTGTFVGFSLDIDIAVDRLASTTARVRRSCSCSNSISGAEIADGAAGKQFRQHDEDRAQDEAGQCRDDGDRQDLGEIGFGRHGGIGNDAAHRPASHSCPGATRLRDSARDRFRAAGAGRSPRARAP